jgi:hypothetical protein
VPKVWWKNVLGFASTIVFDGVVSFLLVLVKAFIFVCVFV